MKTQSLSEKVISFSLWGVEKKYTIGAIRNCELAKEIYPDWICRFYIGTSTPVSIIEELKNLGADVRMMSEEGNWSGMFWRFHACTDSSVAIMRDTDSRLSLREKRAVDEWLASDKDFHIMRDHPFHRAYILGGMWGARNGILADYENLEKEFIKGDYWQVDQNFLRDVVYGRVKNRAFIHDSYSFFQDEDSKQFPSSRVNGEFVGEVYLIEDFKEIRHPDHYRYI